MAAMPQGFVSKQDVNQQVTNRFGQLILMLRQLTRHCRNWVSDCNARFLNVDVISYATQAELGGTAGSRKTFGGMPARLHVMCAR